MPAGSRKPSELAPCTHCLLPPLQTRRDCLWSHRYRLPGFSFLSQRAAGNRGPRLHIMTAGLGLRGPSEALPQRNGLVCSTPALPHPLGSSRPPPVLTDADGAPTSSPRGASRNPSLASSGPAPPGPELHGAWGPGGLTKRKWRPWDVGRAGRPEKPYSVPLSGSLCPPGPPECCSHNTTSTGSPLSHPSAPSQADFPFAEGVSH